jgi:flagellar M-ring protein FliF
LATSSSKQYEIKRSVETYLSKKAQGMLDNVLGYGNAIVEVNADLNFDQVQKTMESYDPDSQVAISEQTIKSTNGGKSVGDSTAQASQNTTTNYEINKTVQKVVESSGNISRLSVAVVVNDISKEVKKGDTKEIVYEPRSKEQLNKLEDLIKNAVGINPGRNDLFSIESIPFETKEIEPVDVSKPGVMDDVNKWSNPILLIVAAAASLLFLKGLMKKLKNQKIMIGSYSNSDSDFNLTQPAALNQKTNPAMIENKARKNLLPLGDLEDEISDEAARKRVQQEKISNYVAKNPVDAAKLINAWLHAEEF